MSAGFGWAHTQGIHGGFYAGFKEVLSVLLLCEPVFIFTSSSSALLGHMCCGLSI